MENIFHQFPDFHKWVTDKKPDPGALSLFRELSDTNKARDLLTWLGQNRPSCSLGVQILETAGELLLMGKDLSSVFKETERPEGLLKKLMKLRYPQATQRDEEKGKQVLSLPWPGGVKARWLRQNDTSGLEVRFVCFSLKDFKRKVQGLDLVHKQMKEDGGKLWG